MSSRCHHNTSVWLIAACVTGGLLAGCSTLGPTAISNGRLTYNEAIVATENQQILMLVVHNRYEESGNLLAVASVTANVNVTTGAGIQLGIGNESNYAGNLVPFGAGVIYEENPTISYIPVGGDKYTRQIFSPIPVSVLAELLRGIHNPTSIYAALISGVNGIYNPEFLGSAMEADPRFTRFVSLMETLSQAHRLHWVEARYGGALSIVIDRSSTGFENEVDELLGLLGLPPAEDYTQTVVLPVSLALDGRSSGGVGITTRSVWDLVEILSAAIDVPEDDQQKNIASTYPPSGLAGSALRIRLSDEKPDGAYVAVDHRGNWFYIDETDQATKRFFRLLRSLLSVAMAESAINSTAAPVLTVPVSR